MSAAADLIAYLDPLIAESAATSLFEATFTESPDNQVCLVDLSGDDAEREMGSSLTAPAMERAGVQVMVRNTAMATARSRAHAIHALLDNLQGQTISGTSYLLVASRSGEPYFVGQDENERWVYAATYDVSKTRG